MVRTASRARRDREKDMISNEGAESEGRPRGDEEEGEGGEWHAQCERGIGSKHVSDETREGSV